MISNAHQALLALHAALVVSINSDTDKVIHRSDRLAKIKDLIEIEDLISVTPPGFCNPQLPATDRPQGDA